MKRCIEVVRCVLAGIVIVSCLAGSAFAASGSSTANTGPLQVVKTIPIGSTGGWDYLTVDSQADRLYVSHGNQVMVLDTTNDSLVGQVANTPGVHGIAIVPELNEGYTSNGRESKLSVFDLKTLKTLRKVVSGQNPDSIIYDPFTKKVFAFNHTGGDITVVDTTDPNKAPATIQVGGTLETGVSDLAGHVYVNVENKSEIVSIDSKKDKILAHWPIAPGEEPTGLAIDREHHRLFAGCGNQMMIVVDSNDGKVLGNVPIGPGCDGVTFVASPGLAVSSNGGNGTVTVVKEEPAGKFSVIQTLKTTMRARTITSDPKTNLIYLPCNINTNGQNQFSVLVVGPTARP